MENLNIERDTLSTLKCDECGKICEIAGGRCARRRLCELGLNRGVNVKVVKNDLGPLILDIQGHKLAIGRGLASKIIIEK